MDEIRKQFEDGKYTLVRDSSGYMYALRHGEPWRDLTGDKLIGAMLSEIEELQAALAACQPVGEAVCKTCDGTRMVDDGEINCYPDGTPFVCGPVKCVKDCPECAAPPAQQPAQVDLGQFRQAVLDQFDLARQGETWSRHSRIKMQAAEAERDRLLALIDAQAK